MKKPLNAGTEVEEAAILRGIAKDPENPELTRDFFSSAVPAQDILPTDVFSALTTRRRGPGVRPAKALVSLRLDRAVLDGLRASGPGWQRRANEALRKLAGLT